MGWMNYAKDEAINVCSGFCLGMVQGIFGISIYTDVEIEEIHNLKTLALSIVSKWPPQIADPNFCRQAAEGLKSGSESVIETSYPFLPVTAAAAADLVCSKAILPRFQKILAGACLNLIGC